MVVVVIVVVDGGPVGQRPPYRPHSEAQGATTAPMTVFLTSSTTSPQAVAYRCWHAPQHPGAALKHS